MPLLNRRKQFASQLEAAAGNYVGTATLMDTAANYDILALEPSAGFDLDTFERNYARDTISATKSLVGRKSVTYSFQCELNGFGVQNTGTALPAEPGWSKWLRVAGMRAIETSAWDFGANAAAFTTAGPFRNGELVTLSFTGGTPGTDGQARLIHDWHDGQRIVTFSKDEDYVAPAEGTTNTALTITGQSSGAVYEDTSITTDITYEAHRIESAGYSWVPISTSIKSARVDYTTGTAAWDDQPASGDILEERLNSDGTPTGVRIKYVSDHPNFTTDSDAGEGLFYFEYIRGGTLTNGAALYNLTQGVYAAGDGAGAGSPLDAAAQEGYLYGEALSAALNEDGVYVAGSGVRTNVQWIFEANRPVKMQFDSRGAYEAVGDKPFNASTTEDLTDPPLWSGVASFATAGNEDGTEDALINEISPCLANMTLDLGNQLSDRICASAQQGVEEVSITARNGTGSMDPEATYEADISWLTDLIDANSVRIRAEVGSGAGNKFLITAPGVTFSQSTTGDREGIMTRELQFQLTGGNLYNLNGATNTLKPYGGDNEVVMTLFTGLDAATN